MAKPKGKGFVHPRMDYLEAAALAVASAEQPPPFELANLPDPPLGNAVRLPGEAKRSVNQIALQRACDAIHAAFHGTAEQRSTAVEINLRYYRKMQEVGHACFPRTNNGGGISVEVGTGGHAQIHYAAWAGALWASRLLGSTELQKAVERTWQHETALTRLCTYRDEKGKFRVLTPGARNEKQGGDVAQPHPDVANSCRDKVNDWLLNGLTKAPKTDSDGYDAAIHCLTRAFAAGAKRKALLGDDTAHLARFGFRIHRNGNGYFSWFETLGNPGVDNILNPMAGAGFVAGQTVFRYERQAAMDTGQLFAAGGAVGP